MTCIAASKRDAVWSICGGKCYICRQKVSRWSFTIEHIIPKSIGGTDEYDNLAVAHQACNVAKADQIVHGPRFEAARQLFMRQHGWDPNNHAPKNAPTAAAPKGRKEPKPKPKPEPIIGNRYEVKPVPSMMRLCRRRQARVPVFEMAAAGWRVIAWAEPGGDAWRGDLQAMRKIQISGASRRLKFPGDCSASARRSKLGHLGRAPGAVQDG